jgi:hypothetical protein
VSKKASHSCIFDLGLQDAGIQSSHFGTRW